jgi:hypothetical protein
VGDREITLAGEDAASRADDTGLVLLDDGRIVHAIAHQNRADRG